MFVFGFQEIVELKPVNILYSNNNDITISWKNFIEKSLFSDLNNITNNNKQCKYTILHVSNLVGILLLVYVKKELLYNISILNSKIIKFGLAGVLGNKGCLILRFNYKLTSFAIVCAHLEAGLEKDCTRHNQIFKILNEKMSCPKTNDLLTINNKIEEYYSNIKKIKNF